MRYFFLCLFATLISLAQALSSTGVRLLIVIEEAAERAKYSQLWADLEGALESY